MGSEASDDPLRGNYHVFREGLLPFPLLAEQRRVNLFFPGVQEGTNQAVPIDHSSSDGQQRRHSDNNDIPSIGQTLHGAQTDAQSGEGSRPDRYSDSGDIRQRERSLLENAVNQRQTDLGMVGVIRARRFQGGFPSLLQNQLAVLHQGHAGNGCGRIDAENSHRKQSALSSQLSAISTPPPCCSY